MRSPRLVSAIASKYPIKNAVDALALGLPKTGLLVPCPESVVAVAALNVCQSVIGWAVNKVAVVRKAIRDNATRIRIGFVAFSPKTKPEATPEPFRFLTSPQDAGSRFQQCRLGRLQRSPSRNRLRPASVQKQFS